MQEINEWLDNSGDFESGMALYLRYGKNSFFKKTLENFGPTAFNTQKLCAELMALAPASPASTGVIPKVIDVPALAQHAPASPEDPASPDPKDTERYFSLKELNKTKYRQMDHNRAALSISSDSNYRHLTAKHILKLHSEIVDIYRLIDYFDAHNRFPVLQAKDDIIRTPYEQIQLLRQSTSKARKRLTSGRCRNIHQTELLIQENDKSIAELTRRIKE